MMAPLGLAFRRLLLYPWSTVVMVLMVGLGIGTSTAVFSIMSEVLLRPLGLSHPERVVMISKSMEIRSKRVASKTFSVAPTRQEADLQRQHNTTLQGVAEVRLRSCVVRVADQEIRRVTTSFVTQDYFRVLEVQPALGRGFSDDEDRSGEPVAILGYGLWKSLFEGDPKALGAGIQVSGRAFRVIGVAPQGFKGYRSGFSGSELWCPAASVGLVGGDIRLDDSDVLARLKPGFTILQAQAALRLVPALPGGSNHPSLVFGPLQIKPLDLDRSQLLAARLPSPWLLLSASGLLLLLACVNAGNLRLAQLESRRQEFATRLAMGATRGDLVRQVLGESLLLALFSGALGLWISGPIMTLLGQVRDVKVYEHPIHPTLSGAALALALGLMVVSALLVSLPAAIQASRSNLSDMLKESSSRLTRGRGFQDALMILQVAMALAMVACGLLVARGFERARKPNLGFQVERIAALRLEFPPGIGEQGAKKALMRELRNRAAALPGVEAACFAEGIPLEDGAPQAPSTEGDIQRFVGPGYLTVMGIPLVAGRDFDELDLDSGEIVRLVSRTYAQQTWPGEDPLGREDRVVGVVEDHVVHPEGSLHQPVVYFATGAKPFSTSLCLLVRTSGKPEALFPALRQIANQVNPDMPILRLVTLKEHLEALHHHLRIASGLLGFCALVSLLLAVTGVQSLMSFRVARQAREVSLRMALGAQRRAILLQVLWRGMSRVLVGLAMGSCGALALARILHRYLKGVDPLNPQNLITALTIIAVASMAACLIPAMRASSLDPAAVLREE